MNITVLGLWHLGSVTAACCAKHYSVVGLDFDAGVVAKLNTGAAPLFEPGLNDRIASGIAAKRLSFTTDPVAACAACDVLWLAYDTPVDAHDESDVHFVLEKLKLVLPHLKSGTLVLISAQLPVGTCAAFEGEFPQFHFACSPENLRLGKAIDAFEKADRVVVGIRNETKKELIQSLFAPFTPKILFMRTESAEMVKHALNAYLALSISFINEVGRLCELTGADAKEVSAGLKSDVRIGPKAYLQAGGAFAGGTLARDVVTLTKLAEMRGETLAVIPAIKVSNDHHRHWALRKLEMRFGDLKGKIILVLGLTYTINTDTLRRSVAVELCAALIQSGATVRVFDPVVKSLPLEINRVTLVPDIASAMIGADAVVVCTEWPQFLEADWAAMVTKMRQPVVLDPNGFLDKKLKGMTGLEHFAVGRA